MLTALFVFSRGVVNLDRTFRVFTDHTSHTGNNHYIYELCFAAVQREKLMQANGFCKPVNVPSVEYNPNIGRALINFHQAG